MRDIILLVHDIRSTHNVGSLLRTADCLGVQHVYFTGYTPYPSVTDDERLPHIAKKLTASIHKTALGAENSVAWSRQADVQELLDRLKNDGYRLTALEQSPKSVRLTEYDPPGKVALLLGREVEGIESGLLERMDDIVEIPMLGSKESLNVVQAAAIALFELGCRPK